MKPWFAVGAGGGFLLGMAIGSALEGKLWGAVGLFVLGCIPVAIGTWGILVTQAKG